MTVICDADSASTLAGILMSETGTLGVRMRMEKRMIAKRSTDSIGLTIRGREFQIRFKTNESQGTFKIEADDIQAVSEHTGEPFGSTERMLREMMGLSPKQQVDSGVAPHDVICRNGLFLVERSTNEIACTHETTAQKMGWRVISQPIPILEETNVSFQDTLNSNKTVKKTLEEPLY